LNASIQVEERIYKVAALILAMGKELAVPVKDVVVGVAGGKKSTSKSNG
jgi:hypothetical protein